MDALSHTPLLGEEFDDTDEGESGSVLLVSAAIKPLLDVPPEEHKYKIINTGLKVFEKDRLLHKEVLRLLEPPSPGRGVLLVHLAAVVEAPGVVGQYYCPPGSTAARLVVPCLRGDHPGPNLPLWAVGHPNGKIPIPLGAPGPLGAHVFKSGRRKV